MKEILSIIGKALTDIAEVLPDRAEGKDSELLAEVKSLRSDIGKFVTAPDTECTGCAVKPEPEVRKAPPVGDSKDAPPAHELNECVETAPPVPPVQTAPPVPPVQTAPPVPPVQTAHPVPPVQTAPTDTTELDSEGIPWDKRIHSSGKTKYKQTVGDKKQGAWIHRKGVDPIMLAQVKSELYQKYHPADTEPVVDQFQSVPPVSSAPPVQQELPLPTASGELPPYGAIDKWAQLMREAAGKGVNHVTADGILVAAGLPTVAALQNSPSMIPAAALALGLTGPQS